MIQGTAVLLLLTFHVRCSMSYLHSKYYAKLLRMSVRAPNAHVDWLLALERWSVIKEFGNIYGGALDTLD